MQNEGVESCWDIEEGDVNGIVRTILWTSKGGIGRWKLTEVEERFFGGNCSVDSMQK